MKFHVIDIEATGGNHSRTRMMEIAVFTVENGEIVDEFSTLVNPGKNPDAYVQKMTGITPKMLRKAPKFEQVAARLLRMFQGGVIVAHNAPFDYGLLRKEFGRLGYDLQLPYLCTLDVSRELFPEIENHGLESLTQHLRIPVKHRHRAFGDAYATAQIFKILLQKDPDMQIIGRHIRNGNLEKPAYPKRLTRLIDRVDDRQSVLKIYDARGRLLYAGYAYHPRMKAETLMVKYPALAQRTRRMETEPVPGRLLGRILAQWLNKKHRPPFSRYRSPREQVDFPMRNALLFDRGRFPYEQSIFLIENGRLYGYGYVDLHWQTEDMESLKQRLTPLDDCPYGRLAVMRHWEQKRFDQIKPLDEAPAD